MTIVRVMQSRGIVVIYSKQTIQKITVLHSMKHLSQQLNTHLKININ